MGTRRSAWAFAAVAVAGCLSDANPGEGSRLLGGRDLRDLAWSHGAAEAAPSHIVFSRLDLDAEAVGPSIEERLQPQLRDIFVVPREGGMVRLLARGVDRNGWADWAWDARGRILLGHDVSRSHPDRPPTFQLDAFDLLSEVAESFGRVFTFELSGDGRWITYHQDVDGQRSAANGIPPARVRHVDGFDRGFLDQRKPMVIGENVYSLDPATGDLLRLDPTGQEEVLARGVSSIGRIGGSDAWILVAAGRAFRVHNLASGTELPLRGTPPSLPVLAPDRKRLAYIEDDRRLRLRFLVHVLDVETAADEIIIVPDVAAEPNPARPEPLDPARDFPLTLVWRPDSDELWIAEMGGVRVVRPGAPPLVVGRNARLVIRRHFGSNEAPRSFFTPDGAFWVYDVVENSVRSERQPLFIGDADNPEGEPLVAVDLLAVGPLAVTAAPGGMLVVEANELSETGEDQRGLWRVDIARREVSQLGRRVKQSRTGLGRVLAISDVLGDGESGDLLLHDIATGQPTLVANHVFQFALPRTCVGCDPLSPGAPLAYIIRGWRPWRHDGLWRATLP